METGIFWAFASISDQQLRSGLTTLLASGCRTEARIIAHIAEIEERKLHLRDGSSSLFEHCVKRLGLSESEAFHRITAARVARQFPVVFTMIEGREIHLSAVCLLRDYLTADNHRDLLAEASHKTKSQVQELLARRFPRPDVNSYVRKLPEPSRGNRNASNPAQSQAPLTVPASAQPSALSAPITAPETTQLRAHSTHSALQPPPRARIEPTSEARYRIQLNASSSLKEKLEVFQGLVSHSIPNGDVAAIVERALDLAIEQMQKQRFAKADKPRRTSGARQLNVRRRAKGREHIPNAVQRKVATRDELRCTFVSEEGCRCSARAFLQLHHEEPWARGGEPSVENLRLLCASHNRLLAERDFGAAHVTQRIAESRRAKSPPASMGQVSVHNFAAVVAHGDRS
jgi:HNH endonuclease